MIINALKIENQKRMRNKSLTFKVYVTCLELCTKNTLFQNSNINIIYLFVVISKMTRSIADSFYRRVRNSSKSTRNTRLCSAHYHYIPKQSKHLAKLVQAVMVCWYIIGLYNYKHLLSFVYYDWFFFYNNNNTV